MSSNVPRLKLLGQTATANLALAKGLFQRGMFGQALAELDHILADNPEQALAHFLKGLVLARLADFEAAERCFSDAVALDDALAQAWTALAYARMERGKLSSAQSAIDHSLRLEPKDANAHALRANILSQRNRPKRAIRAYRDALKYSPQMPLARYKLGRLLSETGQTEEAIEQIILAMRLNPLNAEARMTLGDIYRGRGQNVEAVKEYKAAAEIAPQQAEPHFKIAETFLSEGLLPEAMSELRIATRINPKHVDSYLTLAKLYQQVGRQAEAVETLRAAVEADEHYPLAKEMLIEAEAGSAMVSGAPSESLADVARALPTEKDWLAANPTTASSAPTIPLAEAARSKVQAQGQPQFESPLAEDVVLDQEPAEIAEPEIDWLRGDAAEESEDTNLAATEPAEATGSGALPERSEFTGDHLQFHPPHELPRAADLESLASEALFDDEPTGPNAVAHDALPPVAPLDADEGGSIFDDFSAEPPAAASEHAGVALPVTPVDETPLAELLPAEAPATEPPQPVDRLEGLTEAKRRLARGDEEAALEMVDQVLADQADWIPARLLKGLILIQATELEAAKEWLKDTLQLDAQHEPSWLLLARVYEESRQYESALKCLDRALALDHRRANTHLTLGNILAELNRRDEAVAAYRRALRYDPAINPARFKLAITLPHTESASPPSEA